MTCLAQTELKALDLFRQSGRKDAAACVVVRRNLASEALSVTRWFSGTGHGREATVDVVAPLFQLAKKGLLTATASWHDSPTNGPSVEVSFRLVAPLRHLMGFEEEDS